MWVLRDIKGRSKVGVSVEQLRRAYKQRRVLSVSSAFPIAPHTTIMSFPPDQESVAQIPPSLSVDDQPTLTQPVQPSLTDSVNSRANPPVNPSTFDDHTVYVSLHADYRGPTTYDLDHPTGVKVWGTDNAKEKLLEHPGGARAASHISELRRFVASQNMNCPSRNLNPLPSDVATPEQCLWDHEGVTKRTMAANSHTQRKGKHVWEVGMEYVADPTAEWQKEHGVRLLSIYDICRVADNPHPALFDEPTTGSRWIAPRWLNRQSKAGTQD